MLLEQQFNKSQQEIYQQAFHKLTQKTDITSLSPGGIARSFLDIFSDELNETYDILTNSMVIGFVSRAEGVFLDEIGKLVDCDRYPEEDDDNYRYRIVKQNQNLATANEIAIRLACLSVDGVNDIEFKDYLRGIGTFDVYVITNDPEPSQEILNNVQEMINQKQAKGNDGKVLSPRIITIDMDINLIFYEGTSMDIQRNIRQEVISRIEKYINNQRMGGKIIINQLIEQIMSSDQNYEGNKIKNTQINNIYINNDMVFVRDMHFYWDERPVIRNLTIG